jgi:hypothetical protein
MQAVALRRVIYAPDQRPGLVSYRLGPAKLYLDDIEAIYQLLLNTGQHGVAELDEATDLDKRSVEKQSSVQITAGEAIADLPEDLRDAKPRELKRVSLALKSPAVVVELGYLIARVSALRSCAAGRAAAEGIRDYVNSRVRPYSGFWFVRGTHDVIMLTAAVLLAAGYIAAKGVRTGGQTAILVVGLLIIYLSFGFLGSRKFGSVRVIPRRESESRGLSSETRKQLIIALVSAVVLGVLGFWAGRYSGH